MKAVKLDKANSLTHTILIEMQITRKQTSDQSKSSDSTLILNKHGVRVYPIGLSSRNNRYICSSNSWLKTTIFICFFLSDSQEI